MKKYQTSFNGGEISPLSAGRVDLEVYELCLKKALNMVPTGLGPIRKRPGLYFAGLVNVLTGAAKLIPFIFSPDDAHVLEFGDEYMRVFQNGAHVMDGGSPYEIVTVYTEDEVEDIDYIQSANTLFTAHGDHMPQMFERTASDDWTASEIPFAPPPFLKENLNTALYIKCNATSGTGKTLTVTGGNVFESGHVGAFFKLGERPYSQHNLWIENTVVAPGATCVYESRVYSTTAGGTTGYRAPTHTAGDASDGGVTWTYLHNGSGYVKITAVASATSATCDVMSTLPTSVTAGNGTIYWNEGAWSGVRGFPKYVGLDNEKLIFGATDYQPEGVWASRIGSYYDFSDSIPLQDDDALDLTLGGRSVNFIRWIEASRRLFVGTSAGEYWLASADGGGVITPTSKNAVMGSALGGASIKPVNTGSGLVMVRRSRRVVNELKYSYDSDALAGEELSKFVTHLFERYGVKTMAYQRDPYRVIWIVRDDGKLLSLTYYPEQKVVAWALHQTDGVVEDVITIPGAEADILYLIVNRASGRFVEYMSPYVESDEPSDYFFLDSGLTYDERQEVESVSFTNPGVVNLTAHGYSDGDMIMFRTEEDKEDEDYDESAPSLHYERFYVAHKTADTFRLHDADGADVDLTGYTPFTYATVGKVVSSVTGLDHLEGVDVEVVVDGAPLGSPLTVTGGAIALEAPGSVVHVGLPFRAEMRTLPPLYETSDKEISAGVVQLMRSVKFGLHRSAGFDVGADPRRLKKNVFATPNTPLGRPAPLFSGYTDELGVNRATREAAPSFILRSDDAVPLTVVSITYEMEDEG